MMTTVPTESAVDSMRTRVRDWFRSGPSENPDCTYVALVDHWVGGLDDQALAALMGMTEGADGDAAQSMAELGAKTCASSTPRGDAEGLVTRLLEGPAGISESRVCLLRGAFLGALAAADAGARVERRRRHDLTSPLQAALLNLELTLLERTDDPELTEALTTVKGSLDQTVQLLAKQPGLDDAML